jgi:hypothetical protein
MDDRAIPAPGIQAGSRTHAVRRRIAELPHRWQRFGSILLACYAVIVVFGATYGIVRLVTGGTSPTTAIAWGICVAAPLLVAFIWDRLGGFKAFGVELTLTQALVRVDSTLGTALSASEEQYFSGNEGILRLVDRVIANPGIELLEINLRTTRYWWSTRIYLQAALAEDYTKVQRLVFVDGDAERRYVGMAAPGEVRRALAQQSGADLESAYQDIRKTISQGFRPPNQSEAQLIASQWAVHVFSKDGQALGEEQVKALMPAAVLARSVELETHSVERSRPLDSPALQALVLEGGFRFVPLTRNGQLDRVVNADAFARSMAAEALRAQLR